MVAQTPILILLLEGDGIGPEIPLSAGEVLHYLNQGLDLGLALETADIGWKAFKTDTTTFPESVLERARLADGVVPGPVSHNEYPNPQSGSLNPSGELRRHLDLYANIRPARSRAAHTAEGRKVNRFDHRQGEHRGLLRRSIDVLRPGRSHANPRHGFGLPQSGARRIDANCQDRL
jgi:isocitrate/isopropylmalate dehydrogenase